jgi:hypothetical protein
MLLAAETDRPVSETNRALVPQTLRVVQPRLRQPVWQFLHQVLTTVREVRARCRALRMHHTTAAETEGWSAGVLSKTRREGRSRVNRRWGDGESHVFLLGGRGVRAEDAMVVDETSVPGYANGFSTTASNVAMGDSSVRPVLHEPMAPQQRLSNRTVLKKANSPPRSNKHMVKLRGVMRFFFAMPWVLFATIAQANPRSVEEATVAFDRLRSRYAQSLSDAQWQRDDPRVRAVANDVTEEALAIGEEVPSLMAEVRVLVGDAGGDALGPWLERHGVSGDPLLASWLRNHDDVALYQRLRPRDERGRIHLAAEVLFTRPVFAAELAVEGLSTSPGIGGAWCFLGLALPTAQRTLVLRALATQPLAATFGHCLALQSLDATARIDLARRTVAELTREPNPNDDESRAWPLVGAALTLPSMTPMQAARVLHVVESDDRRIDWPTASFELARAMPYIASENPRVLRVLAQALHRSPVAFARRLPYVSRALLAQLHRMRPQPNGTTALRDEALLLETALTASRGPESTGLLRSLMTLRSRLRGANDATLQRVDDWCDALEATEHCDDQCLQNLTVHAGETTAARAVWILGSRGLAQAPIEIHRALVNRLVFQTAPDEGVVRPSMLPSASTLAAVFYAVAQTCHPEWRGLAMRAPTEIEAWIDPSGTWRMKLGARCRDTVQLRVP